MKCVILAAGEGKRMHPLTYTRPKVMLPIANKPMMEWNLLNAKKAGITDFLFVVHYKHEMVRSYFKDGSPWNTTISYVNQGSPLGTGHAIAAAEPFVDDFLVLSGDTIFGADDIKHLMNSPMSMGLTQVEDPSQYGVVETHNNKIKKIYEKTNEPPSNMINAGIYHFNSSIFSYIKKIPKSPRGEYEITDAINMMATKKSIHGITIKQWRDVVYPWDLLDANQEKLQKLPEKRQGTIEKHTTLKGPVSIGKDTIVMNGAYIEGPVIIGENCKIGPNCYIRPYTSIGNHCHIGNACEVKNSVIMDHSNVPHQSYVGDSIIGSHCNLGSGTKIANLRLDKKDIKVTLNGERIATKRRKLGAIIGDNTQTGINTVLDIGSIIGNNVHIGPNGYIAKEIQPDSKVM